MAKKSEMGRPKRELSSLPKGWKKGVLDLAEVGASDVEMRGYLNISTDLWYRFIEEEPDFSETVQRCAQSCQIWWERHARLNLDNKTFNTQLWFINMKNRFKDSWADKQEIDHTTNGKEITTVTRQIVDKT